MDAVIPTCYPDERLLALLTLLHRQDAPLRRIRIVNTERAGWERLLRQAKMTDEAFAARFPLVTLRHITAASFDHGGTRGEEAARCAGAQYLLMMTQDALPCDTALTARLLEPLEADPQAAVAYARQLPNEGASETERYTRAFNYPPEPQVKSQADFDRLGVKTYFCSNVCALYRKETFDRLGGFVRRAIFNEDMLYAGKAAQAGYRIYYQAAARVYHSHSYTAAQQFHRNFDLGVSQADHPEIFAAARSEGEGVRYVKTVAAHLWRAGAKRELPGFLAGCAARLLGYRLGRAYRRLPRRLVLACTGSRWYWEK